MSVESQSNRSLELLTAIVKGDAGVEDGIAELRREGISSLKEALLVLRTEGQANGSTGTATRPDFTTMRRKPPVTRVRNIKHSVPQVPFVLDGILYDPTDIQRFNGQELHFFTSPGKDHMLAVDDRDVMVDWLQFDYFERYRDISSIPLSEHMVAGAFWFEDDDMNGARIFATPNTGFWRLSKVGDDWNDRISSFEMWSVGVVQLSDNLNFEGPFFYHIAPEGSSYASVRSLTPYGWNDRASSCGDW
ncbi:hypothetical protein ABZ743_31960 [Streptomyces sp. NPDC006662]|uniref:hypothetical protein n=1 Tax=Streptomyces sp. NPDC006662 TaxID=3156902 RepID=UPI0033FE18EB